MKIIAELTKWDGEKIEQEIKREWIDDFVDAVAGQYTIINNKDSYGIVGNNFKHINIYEVKDEAKDRR